MEIPLLKEQLTEQLREDILSRRSDKMIRMTPERTLSDELGVSRVSLRAAIKQLVNEELLIQIQGKGTYITPIRCMNMLHVMFSPDIKRNDMFYSSILYEITGIAAREAIELMLISPDQIKRNTDSYALLIIGSLEKEKINQLQSTYRKVVTIGSSFVKSDIFQVYFDNYLIGCDAAKLLIEYNHKNIIHLAGPEIYSSSVNRTNGFIVTLCNYDIKAAIRKGKMNWSCGYNVGDEIIESFSALNNPTAVFAANDWMALGLIQRFKEKGIRVPEDISVIGCDDIPLSSEISPGLTTFSLDTPKLIAEAFSILNTENPDEPKRSKLSASLIIRDSLIKI